MTPLLPFLYRSYPASSVLCSNPTPCAPFGFLTLYRLSAILPLRKSPQGLPSCREPTVYSVPRSLTPGKFRPARLYRLPKCCLLQDGMNRPSHLALFRSSIPSTLRLSARCLACLAQSLQPCGFRPTDLTQRFLPCCLACLRLNIAVTSYAPRLATGGWLNLARWDSHPLSVTTWLGRSLPGLSHSIACLPYSLFGRARRVSQVAVNQLCTACQGL
jgi:hypothetical protein